MENKKQWTILTKNNLKSFFIFIVLFLGTMAFLDEFYNIRDRVNLYIIGFVITFFIIFIWNTIIKKILNKLV